MESNGKAGMVHCSESSRILLEEAGYGLEFRGELEIKGKGLMKTYWVQTVPESSQKMIKLALAMAAESLKELEACRRDAESSTSSDGSDSAKDSAKSVARTKTRKTTVQMWDRDHHRGLHMDMEDYNRVNTLKHKFEHQAALTKSASVDGIDGIDEEYNASDESDNEDEGPQRAKRMVSEFEKTGAAPAGKCPFGFDKLAARADEIKEQQEAESK
mmetsp:Transcript_42777/g.68677  ORF Transcript_42777/g.68677 Transcript_42777/m.68677 type:complete len:215 (-) Transcript_42777:131-775(-)